MNFPAFIAPTEPCPGLSTWTLANMSASLVAELLSPTVNNDHTHTVRELGKNKIWSSIPPESYQPNQNINFLHIKEDGTIVITVFKSNTKPRHIYVKIKPEEVAQVRQKLQWMQQWDKVDEKGWDNANGEGNIDGNTYHSHRKVMLWDDGFELHWIVNHKNVGNQVLVGDKLLIARDGTILAEESPEEAVEN